MKVLGTYLLSVIFWFLFGFICCVEIQAVESSLPKVITIASEEYAPYTGTALANNGVDCEIVFKAFASQGIRVKFVFVPGARSYQMAQSGTVAATLPWAMRDQRKIDFWYSDPVIEIDLENFFYVESQAAEMAQWNPQQRDYALLRGKRISAITGHDYGPAFQEAEASGIITVSRVRTIKQGFQMLLKKRVDLLISKPCVAKYVLLNSDFDEVEALSIKNTAERIGQTAYDYLLFSKKFPQSEDLLKAFNRGLEQLKKNGQYDKIISTLVH